MGKGSRRRKEDFARVQRNWDMVFGKHNPHDTRKVEIDNGLFHPAKVKLVTLDNIPSDTAYMVYKGKVVAKMTNIGGDKHKCGDIGFHGEFKGDYSSSPS